MRAVHEGVSTSERAFCSGSVAARGLGRVDFLALSLAQGSAARLAHDGKGLPMGEVRLRGGGDVRLQDAGSVPGGH